MMAASSSPIGLDHPTVIPESVRQERDAAEHEETETR
ncbi:MAG: hypothetical protein J07HQX50_00686 [Haloquadratum sp. J07HQX50]|nr:MAG: hypothetical protein J07HQX50_00686 [Haloquadratum sp. J07HQX50]